MFGQLLLQILNKIGYLKNNFKFHIKILKVPVRVILTFSTFSVPCRWKERMKAFECGSTWNVVNVAAKVVK